MLLFHFEVKELGVIWGNRKKLKNIKIEGISKLIQVEDEAKINEKKKKKNHYETTIESEHPRSELAESEFCLVPCEMST